VQGEQRTEARRGGHRNSQRGKIAEEVWRAGAGIRRGGTLQRRDVENTVTGKERGAWARRTR
jgi:hypothetical protein